MNAIRVQYVGPTETRGSRWRVTCDQWRTDVPYDAGMPEGMDGARLAADAFVESFPRLSSLRAAGYRLVGGALDGDLGYAFVWMEAAP